MVMDIFMSNSLVVTRRGTRHPSFKDSFKRTLTPGCFADHLFSEATDFEKGNLSVNVNMKSLKCTGHFGIYGSMTTQLHLVRTVMLCLMKDPYLWSSSDHANRKCKHLNSQTRCVAHTNERNDACIESEETGKEKGNTFNEVISC